MRLAEEQKRVIPDETETIFGAAARVRVFGSRVDDNARGGDIDIHIQTDSGTASERLDREPKRSARFARRLGERRIDIVLQSTLDPPRAIDRVAFQTGIKLRPAT